LTSSDEGLLTHLLVTTLHVKNVTLFLTEIVDANNLWQEITTL